MNTKVKHYPETSNMTIAHLASTAVTTWYYVEEAEFSKSNVIARYYDENDPESPVLVKLIKIKDLTDFIEKYYGDYINTGYSEHRIQDVRSPLEYLKENLDAIVTEYLNAGGKP